MHWHFAWFTGIFQGFTDTLGVHWHFPGFIDTGGALALLGFNSILGVGFIDTLGVHWRFAGFTGTFWGSLTLWGYIGTLVFTGILGVHRHFGSMARLLAPA